jgi:hypothetical protein
MFSLYRIINKYASVAASLLLVTVSLSGIAQNRITTIEMWEANNNKFAFTTEDMTTMMGTADKPYVLYGTDFHGSGGFNISFNLETRQTVQYQLVDMMGRQVAAQDLREVLDQTYRVQANSITSGAYIVRLMIDRKCYTEKVFFTP